MRVIAGNLRGRRLCAAPETGVRPTGDRVREALFSILGAALGSDGWAGRAILDLYAGSGALAIEALSRGAARAVLVERSPAAATVIAENLASCGLEDRARVERADVLRWLAWTATRPDAAGGPFHVIFADPPYAGGEHAALLAAVTPALCAPDVTLVVEHEAGTDLPEVIGDLRRTDQRRYGRAGLSFYGPAGEKAPADTSAS